MLPAKHPGEILLNRFMRPLGLSANQLARALHVPSNRVGEIVNGRRSITAETALRLSRFLGTTPKYWFDLQTEFELGQAEEKWALTIEQQIQPLDSMKSKAASSEMAVKPNGRRKLERPTKLNPDEKKVFDLLSDDLTHFDVLCRRSGMSAGAMSSSLTMLEISELVKRHPGDYYSKFDVSR